MNLPKQISRCILLMVIWAVCVEPAVGDGPNPVFTRQVMLKAMAQKCIVPGTVELAEAANGLSRAARDLANKPHRKTVERARQAWTKMQMVYKRNEMLCYGPVEDQAFWQANFYQMTHPGLIEYTIDGRQPIDQPLMDKVGATARGFFAAQYLLFTAIPAQIKKAGLDGTNGTNSFVSWFLQGTNAPRRRQYLCAVAQDLSQHLQSSANKAQAPDFTAKFAAGGQDSVNLLVDQLIATMESNLILPLQLSLNPAFTKRAGLSEARLAGMEASLDGLHRFYRGAGGPGLNDYLRRINPRLNDQVEAQFQSAAKTLRAVDKPLETMDAAHRPPVEKALEQTHKLELLLKVDVVSAMGVTIMFHGYDGD